MDAFDLLEAKPILEQSSLKSKVRSLSGDAFDQLPEPEEGFWKNAARTAYQLASGALQAFTFPADIFNMIATTEGLEGLEEFKRAAGKEGIPFDEEKYLQAVEDISRFTPTQSNLERIAEEKFGAPLTAKSPLQKGLKLGAMAATLQPGTILQKGVSGVTAPIISSGLQKAGVPESLSDIAGLGISGVTGAKTPKIDIGKAKKPSGLIKRRFEKLQKPADISSGKIRKIDAKLEKGFRDISDKIISESPVGKTYSELKKDVTFKKNAREAFKEVEALAEKIPETINTAEVKKSLVDRVLKKKGTGFLPSEYDKSHKKFIKQFLKETPSQEVNLAGLVTQYRKNNEALTQTYEPGQSFAYNRAKRQALTDYNKAISDVIENRFSDTEFSDLFKSTNKQWSEIMDAEAIDKFIDGMLKGKIKFEKGKNFFDKEGMSLPFKRALGKEGFSNFEQLMKDFMGAEQGYRMMKAAHKKGFFRTASENALAFFMHPNIGKLKFGYDVMSKGYRAMWEILLDKPQLAVTWDKGIKAFKKGDFANAERAFQTMKREAEVIHPSEIIIEEPKGKEGPKFEDIVVKPEKIADEKKLIKGPEIEKGEVAKETIKSKKISKPTKKEKIPETKLAEVKRQNISKEGLKSQKQFILEKLNDVLKNPNKYADQEKIDLAVPGDGEFKIHNNEKALRQFMKDVEKRWPDKALRKSGPRKHVEYPPEALKEYEIAYEKKLEQELKHTLKRSQKKR